MRAWLAYAGIALLVTLAGGGIATVLASDGAVARAIWLGAGIALVLQLMAFGILAGVRRRSELFLIGWLSGLVLRFAGVGVVAFWLSRSAVVPIEPALLSMVGFVFVLLLVEPLFLRWGLQTR